ncbi:MAG: hypothetical protein WAP57_12050 [Aquabacterium commune]|uniref:hypothetical protein n=1 Tax=Aquabacterium commune TaxID=70586 RepID=UPI003BAFF00B
MTVYRAIFRDGDSRYMTPEDEANIAIGDLQAHVTGFTAFSSPDLSGDEYAGFTGPLVPGGYVRRRPGVECLTSVKISPRLGIATLVVVEYDVSAEYVPGAAIGEKRSDVYEEGSATFVDIVNPLSSAFEVQSVKVWAARYPLGYVVTALLKQKSGGGFEFASPQSPAEPNAVIDLAVPDSEWVEFYEADTVMGELMPIAVNTSSDAYGVVSHTTTFPSIYEPLLMVWVGVDLEWEGEAPTGIEVEIIPENIDGNIQIGLSVPAGDLPGVRITKVIVRMSPSSMPPEPFWTGFVGSREII